MLDRNRKAIEAGGFSIIIGIVLLLLSAGVILASIKYASSKLDESLQVKLCRTLNEIKFRFDKDDSAFVSGSAVCNTINKHSKKGSFVPTSKYIQDKEGAEAEIREMLKNCWYMWLEGSRKDMFKGYTTNERCFTCYTFKIKDNIKGVTLSSLENSMDNPYIAKDTSDKCAPIGGGYWRDKKCNPGERESETKNFLNTDSKCCVKDRNECENKGGICLTSKASQDQGMYTKWSCPKSEQNCYIMKNSLFSYTNYIREYGPRGGEIYFIPQSGGQSTDMGFNAGEIYAVSFVSPSEKFCIREGAGSSAGCMIATGTYGLVVAGAGVLLVKLAAAGSAAGVLTATGKTVGAIGLKGGALAFGAYQFGVLDNLLRKSVNFFTSPITEEVPNFIIVSTLEHAIDNGCVIKYVE